MAVTNKVATDIAVKRLSGKAHTNANFGIGSEPYGSTVQTLAEAVFAETLPNNPAQTLWLIQSSSVSDPGTAMFVELDVVPFGSQYQNTTNADAGDLADQGEGGADTYHAYALVLSSSFDTNVVESTFNTNASTDTTWGNFPFVGGSYATGSRGKLQIIPEFASNIPAGVPTSDNPYTPKLYGTDGSYIGITNGIDYYVDTYSGILFVQDPADYGTAGSPNIAATVPGKVLAFIYVGKFQDAVTFGAGDVGLHISASEGTGFSLSNDATASFESGSAGITVTAGATNTITIGAATDNVTFNNITATGDIIAQNYIVSSSVTYMTQSFSSGSTIFGDTDNDTHEFTGSISIVHTGSGYGFQMSGSNFLIDWGASGSVTLGTHNVGVDIASPFEITGSGLIVSQSNLPNNHYNMVKIGDIELVDYNDTILGNNSFIIDVKHDRAIIISSSNTQLPIANIEYNNHKFYGNTGANTLLELNSTTGTKLQNADIQITANDTLTLLAPDTLSIRAGNDVDDNVYSTNKMLLIGQNDLNAVNGNQVKPALLSNIYPLFKGAVTASAVSSSGLLYASSSDAGTNGSTYQVALLDTASGLFYTTASSAIQGDTTAIETDITELQASASAGIYISASEGTGFSLGLMQSASFTSGAGGGLTVTAGATNNIEFELIGVLSSSQQIATDISGAIDAATGSLSASIVGTTYEVEVTNGGIPGDIVIGLPNEVRISSSLQVGTNDNDPADATITTSHTTFNLLNTNATTINFGGAATTLNMGAVNGTVNIAGSASIAGDLVVQGVVTSINTENLLVEDRYILLASSSDTNNVGGGIIVQRSAQNIGTALHWDEANDVWALDIAGADASTGTAKALDANIAFVSHSAGLPGTSYDAAVIVGASDDYKKGQFYVDTSDDYGLYVYL